MVLSGMLDDGTAGLWAVKDRGGTTIVQSPEDTLYPSMPQSALQHVVIDHVLPLAEMAAVLTHLTSETIICKVNAPMSKSLQVENHIAREGNALQAGVMNLGLISGNTCPECHGVLVKIKEGPLARYRCHTGHAFSLKTLLADVNEAIDRGLWNATRAIEERILLLREMEEQARSRGDDAAAEEHARQARNTERGVQEVRKVVLDHGILGHDPTVN
jgi:two-component system chemotaxis response regulator CheB